MAEWQNGVTMREIPVVKLICWVAIATISAGSHAQQACDINGEWVNPNNGSTTAGKTGIMRCRERNGHESGLVVREQELQNGRFMGIVRYYKDGVLEREYSVNENGNREGLSRDYAATPGKNPLLREETLRNGTTVGLTRTWYESGQLRRVSFYGDKGQNEAVAEFTPGGKLSELRCAARAQLAPHADDAAWCGFGGNGGGAPGKVTLYSSVGTSTASRARKSKPSLWMAVRGNAKRVTTTTDR